MTDARRNSKSQSTTTLRKDDMNPQAFKKYMESKGNCPFCLGSDIDGEDLTVDGNIVTQLVHCHNCGAQWKDTYTRTRAEMILLPSAALHPHTWKWWCPACDKVNVVKVAESTMRCTKCKGVFRLSEIHRGKEE